MNILCVGNSFSQDATRYLHDIAKNAHVEMDVANLYIGGCSLEMHYQNSLCDEPAYLWEENGQSSGSYISLKDALLKKAWDFVSIQQASHFSFDYRSYQPYATNLTRYIATHCPNAKIVIHQTWAYEKGSQRLLDVAKFSTPESMMSAIKQAYQQLSTDIHAHQVIPSGEMFAYLLANGIDKVHRDTFHASYGIGRYALGLLWFHMLTGLAVKENTFSDFDEPIAEDAIRLIKCYIDTL